MSLVGRRLHLGGGGGGVDKTHGVKLGASTRQPKSD